MYNLEWQWPKIEVARNCFVFEFDPGMLGQRKVRDQVFYGQEDSSITERNGQRTRYVER